MDELTKQDVIDLTQDDGVHHHYVNIGEESDTQVHLRIELEMECEAQNQRLIEEEMFAEAENIRRMEEEQEEERRIQAEREQHQHELQLEADRRLQIEQEERERLEHENRVRLRMVANEMREASRTNFLPPQTQIECVTRERYTVHEAITRGGDHRTPCHRCARNDPDECFWILKTVGMFMDGRMIRTGRGWQNNQVRHYLYRTFIHEEYAYLVDHAVEDHVDGRVGIPRMPLPFCIERDIKRQFPNEDGRPFVGFRRRRN